MRAGALPGRHGDRAGGRRGRPGRRALRAEGRGVRAGGRSAGGPAGGSDAGEDRAMAHHEAGGSGEDPGAVPPVEGASPGTQGENPREEATMAGAPGGAAAVPEAAARDLPERRAAGEADPRGVFKAVAGPPPRTAPRAAEPAGRVAGPSRGHAGRTADGMAVLPGTFPRRAEDGEPLPVLQAFPGTEGRPPRFLA